MPTPTPSFAQNHKRTEKLKASSSHQLLGPFNALPQKQTLLLLAHGNAIPPARNHKQAHKHEGHDLDAQTLQQQSSPAGQTPPRPHVVERGVARGCVRCVGAPPPTYVAEERGVVGDDAVDALG